MFCSDTHAASVRCTAYNQPAHEVMRKMKRWRWKKMNVYLNRNRKQYTHTLERPTIAHDGYGINAVYWYGRWWPSTLYALCMCVNVNVASNGLTASSKWKQIQAFLHLIFDFSTVCDSLNVRYCFMVQTVHMMPYLTVISNDSFSVILLSACRRLRRRNCYSYVQLNLHTVYVTIVIILCKVLSLSLTLARSLSPEHSSYFFLACFTSFPFIRSGGRYLMWVLYALYKNLCRTHNSPVRIISH